MAETVSSEAQNTALASVFFRILRANARAVYATHRRTDPYVV